MFRTVSIAAMTAVLVSMAAPSLAQTTSGTDPAAAPDPAVSEPDLAPAGDPATAAAGAPAEPAPKPVDGQIRLQSENSILASELLGAPVYSPSEELIGDIEDVILTLDGEVEGVVIGVGGFLGIGKKLVAVEMSAVSVTPDEFGDMRLYLSASRADLEAAPVFETKAVQEANERAREMQADMADESAVPAPEAGDGPAPATQ